MKRWITEALKDLFHLLLLFLFVLLLILLSGAGT